MLRLARQFETVLRAEGIDPEEVEKIELDGAADEAQLVVAYKPKTARIFIEAKRKEINDG